MEVLKSLGETGETLIKRFKFEYLFKANHNLAYFFFGNSLVPLNKDIKGLITKLAIDYDLEQIPVGSNQL